MVTHPNNLYLNTSGKNLQSLFLWLFSIGFKSIDLWILKGPKCRQFCSDCDSEQNCMCLILKDTSYCNNAQNELYLENRNLLLHLELFFFFIIVKKTILWQLQTDSFLEFIFIYIISIPGIFGWFRFDYMCSLICSNLSNINCRLLNSNSLTTVRDDTFSGLPHLEYLWVVVLLNSLFIKKPPQKNKHVDILIHDYIFSSFWSTDIP